MRVVGENIEGLTGIISLTNEGQQQITKIISFRERERERERVRESERKKERKKKRERARESEGEREREREREKRVIPLPRSPRSPSPFSGVCRHDNNSRYIRDPAQWAHGPVVLGRPIRTRV